MITAWWVNTHTRWPDLLGCGRRSSTLRTRSTTSVQLSPPGGR